MLHKHLFKKYFIISLLFIGGIILGVILVASIDHTFRIQKIGILGVSQEEQKNLVPLLKGLSTLTTSSFEIKKIITARYPILFVKESRIIFPHSLSIVIEKEKPLAYLKTDSGYIALSKSGMIIVKERSNEVPIPAITFYQSIPHSEYQMGHVLGFAAIERALLFITLLETEGYSVKTVAIDSVDMIACKTKGFEIAFSQTRPVDLQTHEARQIIRQIKAGALRIERLDLRFDKPVVQLPKK